jgi:16S rRNA (guanine1516-N2)-methyltransferase
VTSEVELTEDAEGRPALQLEGMKPEVLGIYDEGIARRGRAGRREPLLRALGDCARVVDATAGLGRDTGLLLAAGLEVIAVERQAKLCALWRAAKVEGLTFVEGDAASVLGELAPPPDGVVIDPMFPAGSYRGQVKRASQILRALEAPDLEGARALVRAARAVARRVVVKRPKGAEALEAPSYSVDVGVTRLDVYVA